MTAKPRTALITGASSGIGLEMARLLARDDVRLALSAKDKERLERAARWILGECPGATIVTIPADLARAGTAAGLFERAESEIGPIDLLINNAGVGIAGPFSEADEQKAIDLLQLNITALVVLTRRALPVMIARREGRILNVASTAAYLPGPRMALYYASKAFVLSFGEAVAEEVRGTGISVTTLCPGPVPTGFQERAGIESAGLLRGPLSQPATEVARAGITGALAGRRVVVPGLANKASVALMRLVPRRCLALLAQKAHAPRRAPASGLKQPDDIAPPEV